MNSPDNIVIPGVFKEVLAIDRWQMLRDRQDWIAKTYGPFDWVSFSPISPLGLVDRTHEVILHDWSEAGVTGVFDDQGYDYSAHLAELAAFYNISYSKPGDAYSIINFVTEKPQRWSAFIANGMQRFSRIQSIDELITKIEPNKVKSDKALTVMKPVSPVKMSGDQVLKTRSQLLIIDDGDGFVDQLRERGVYDLFWEGIEDQNRTRLPILLIMHLNNSDCLGPNEKGTLDIVKKVSPDNYRMSIGYKGAKNSVRENVVLMRPLEII